MGNRSSAKAPEEAEASDESADEDFFAQFDDMEEEDEEAVHDSKAKKAAEAKRAPEKTPPVKTAAPKKKAPAPVPMMTPAAVAAAKKAAKASKEPKVGNVAAGISEFHQKQAEAAKQEEEAASGKPRTDAAPTGACDNDPRNMPLPKGDVGTVWEALEDSIVREGKDTKSARCGGAIQVGERCEQTGPWRADTSGRVRMPMKGPRGLEGWVTIDERRCLNMLDKTYGNLCFKLAPPDPVAKPAEENANQEEKAGKDDEFLDFLLEGYDRSEELKQKEEQKLAKKQAQVDEAAALGMSLRAYRKLQAVAARPDEPANPETDLAGGVASDAEVEAEPHFAEPFVSADKVQGDTGSDRVEGSTFTEAQKRMRALQKKLREVSALEEKLKTDSKAVTTEQRAKLEKSTELRRQLAEVEVEVAAEAQAAAKPKKKKKKGKQESSAQKKTAHGGAYCPV
eukprot:CAMPEP_0117579768 /NCGR_PEP_ID=MMETSP0784-20121206/64806_1 /TAXON_ID=39447 /ORGANISM="" /LENGTH=452 /DNA_ID=CAMNT_0005379707 /DNA_START=22 /DNA_END=1377 /DNA_ORIENTATION=-